MQGWIDGLLNWLSGGISSLARYVAGALASLFNVITGMLSSANAAFNWLANMALNFRDALFNTLGAIYWQARYVLGTVIPRALAQAWQAASQFASTLFNNAMNAINSGINWLYNLAVSLVSDLRNFVNSIYRWALDLFTSIINKLEWVYQRVVSLLTDPASLANWLVDAIWHALWRYVYDRRIQFSQYLLRNAVSSTAWIAGLIEEIIAAIL